MKKLLLIFFLIFFFGNVESQIKKIAVWEADWVNPGLFGINDTCVYKYSIYFEEWFPLANNGLPRFDNQVNIKAIAVADTGTSYTSGIYVIADTAVFNYNWYYDEWYALSNTGLIRISGIVQLSDLSIYGKGTSTDHNIFAVSANTVFEYEWYLGRWYPLSNEGTEIKSINQKKLNHLYNYPNPYKNSTTIDLKIQDTYSGSVIIAVYSQTGKLVDIINFSVKQCNHIQYEYNRALKSGIYFYELKAGKNKYISKMTIQ